MDRALYPEDRRKKIVDIIKGKNGNMPVKELAGYIKISQSALYKDLSILENQRIIKKTYGRLEFLTSEERHHNFYLNLQKNAAKKKMIARKAVTLVNDNETLFIDGSTTTFYFCEELKKQNLQNITIITNSIFVPREMIMQGNINIICVGGMVNKFIGTSDGEHWELLVKNNFYANKFFFSCYSMSTDVGVLDPVQTDASMKAVFAAKSQKKICLVDSSKFKLYSTHNWISLEKIDIIISDSGIDPEVSDGLKAKGMELIIAS
ncbi:MAG: DeoR/GlpR transcriptional regulator [Actinobacteria bacterium]|nr:DeoR/GlpR transcriptional regulator [Actinomycetota bacterium]